MARDPRIPLDDMIVAMDRIAEAVGTLTFEQFAADWRAQYIVERALLIISEASRAIPESSKEKHASIRWIGVRDIGNVIRHQYASLSPSLIWNVVAMNCLNCGLQSRPSVETSKPKPPAAADSSPPTPQPPGARPLRPPQALRASWRHPARRLAPCPGGRRRPCRQARPSRGARDRRR
jgi:uncharacterized protein with HEPN domain